MSKPIAIFAALPGELKSCVSDMTISKTEEIFSTKISIGSLFGRDIIACVCGIGKSSCSTIVSACITKYDPEMVVLIGTAGRIYKNLNVGDIIIADSTRFHDVKMTDIPKKENMISFLTKTFEMDNLLINNLLNNFPESRIKLSAKLNYILKREHINIIRGKIITGDSVIMSKFRVRRLNRKFPDAFAVDMESCAFAHASYLHKQKFIIIKVISDYADVKTATTFLKNYKAVTGLIKPVLQKCITM